MLSLRRLACLVAAGGVVLAPAAGRAQEADAGTPDRSFGIAIVWTPQPYVGTDEELIPVPIFEYRRGHFFIEGIRVGYEWGLPGGWALQTSVMPQFAELDPESSPFLKGMEKRRISADGSLALAWESDSVTASVSAYFDLLGRSHGQRLEADLGFPLTAGRWRIVPAAKAVRVDADFADYYVGVRPGEVRPERPVFRGRAALNPGAALTFMRGLGSKWLLVGRAEVLLLGSGLRDSPVVGDDTVVLGLAGVARRF